MVSPTYVANPNKCVRKTSRSSGSIGIEKSLFAGCHRRPIRHRLNPMPGSSAPNFCKPATGASLSAIGAISSRHAGDDRY